MQYWVAAREVLLSKHVIKDINRSVHTKSLDTVYLVTKTNYVAFHWYQLVRSYAHV